MTGRRLAAIAAMACAAIAAGAVQAQPDDGGGAPTGFWPSVLEPDEARVSELLRRARERADQESAASRAEAKELYAEVLQLDPGATQPRWELARLHARAGAMEACARHLGRLARDEPDFQPSHSVHESPMLLDLELAECLAASDQFSAAADRLRRILARGVTGKARVHAWLAQIEMARGRLEAADYALGQARRLRPHSSELRFIAAVLHDRAGRPSGARRALGAALARDPRLRSVRSPAGRFFPAADEHYLLGLAYAAKDEPHRAALHLRRYLAASPVDLWDDRAREHLNALVRDGLPLGLELSGSASFDEASARSAIAAARSALDACASETPGALYRARLTAFARGGRGPGGPRPGPRVLVDRAFGTDPDALKAAIACAEDVMRGLDLPQPRGEPGQYATLEIPILAP